MNIFRIAAGALAFGLLAVPLASAQTAYSQLQGDNQARFDAWFNYFDSNHDGVMGHDEYAQAQDQRFRAADTNGDGRLSKDEVLAYFSREGANAGAASSSNSGR